MANRTSWSYIEPTIGQGTKTCARYLVKLYGFRVLRPIFFKIYILGAELGELCLKFHHAVTDELKLSFEEGIVLVENSSGTMLSNQVVDLVEQSHVVPPIVDDAPNAVLSGAGHEHHRKRCAVSPRPPRTRSYMANHFPMNIPGI